jgi:hypothetical protein
MEWNQLDAKIVTTTNNKTSVNNRTKTDNKTVGDPIQDQKWYQYWDQ